MNLQRFKQIYNILTEEDLKRKDTFIVLFNIQDVLFLFFKSLKNYVCKFSFEFLNLPHQITVLLKTDNNIVFLIDDSNDVLLQYTKDQFKTYFYYHYNLFIEAVNKFKEFISSNKQLKLLLNTLKIIPLEKILNSTNITNKEMNINIDGVSFNFTKLENSLNDTFSVTFNLNLSLDISILKTVVAIFKTLFQENYFILKVFITKKELTYDILNLEDVIELTKDLFALQYILYFNKLNKAIKTYLNIN